MGAEPHGAKWGPEKCLPFLQSREGRLVVAESVGVTSAKLLQPPGVRHAGHSVVVEGLGDPGPESSLRRAPRLC